MERRGGRKRERERERKIPSCPELSRSRKALIFNHGGSSLVLVSPSPSRYLKRINPATCWKILLASNYLDFVRSHQYRLSAMPTRDRDGNLFCTAPTRRPLRRGIKEREPCLTWRQRDPDCKLGFKCRGQSPKGDYFQQD